MLQRERDRVRAFEMWCWRRLLRVPWTTRRTNISILGELGIQVRLDDIVYPRILQYFGHIMRRESTLEKTIVEGRVWGRRPRGRSPSRWIDRVTKLTGSPLPGVVSEARDRNKWRLTVNRAILLHTNHGTFFWGIRLRRRRYILFQYGNGAWVL